MAFDSIIFFLWVFFVAYWAFSAIGVKKDIRKHSWWLGFLFRFALIVVIIDLLDLGIFSSFWREYETVTVPSVVAFEAGVIGVILCAAGIAFAIWARWHLGKNWSGTPQIKVGHELVTSGPYRFVRHPIYTGILAAMLGTSLVVGPGGFVICIVATVVFLFRIKKEEGFMMQLFPNQYPEYKKRSKALIPFVI